MVSTVPLVCSIEIAVPVVSAVPVVCSIEAVVPVVSTVPVVCCIETVVPVVSTVPVVCSIETTVPVVCAVPVACSIETQRVCVDSDRVLRCEYRWRHKQAGVCSRGVMSSSEKARWWKGKGGRAGHCDWRVCGRQKRKKQEYP